jgi:hypothetical protein
MKNAGRRIVWVNLGRAARFDGPHRHFGRGVFDAARAEVGDVPHPRCLCAIEKTPDVGGEVESQCRRNKVDAVDAVKCSVETDGFAPVEADVSAGAGGCACGVASSAEFGGEAAAGFARAAEDENGGCHEHQ